MTIGINIPYPAEAILAAIRITLWFILLFGFLAPLFLKHIRELPVIEKMIYSWIGLGGIIIFSIFLLSSLHIYDFISFVLFLLLIPVIINIWNNRDKGVLNYLRNVETKLLVAQIKFIESYNGINWAKIKNKLLLKDLSLWGESNRGGLVIFIAVIGGLIRMFPALTNAAPFSRSWFFHLNRIKSLHLQEYFLDSPEPGGMHALVSVFSMLTQLSPEMILHLLGALSSFFLCIIVYWGIRDLTKNKYPFAPIFGMSVYAITPMLLMPISLDQQIGANSVDIALCFAIPTLTIFIRNIRSKYKSPWFYVLSGFVATGMTNLFVAFVILLPLLLLGSLSLPRRRYFKSLGKVIVYLFLMSLIILAPVVFNGIAQGIDLYTFFLEQLYATEAYTYNPSMLMPLQQLSFVYLAIAALLMVLYITESLVKREKIINDELIFLVVFILTALYYSSIVDYSILGLDQDQLNGFYGLAIAFLAGFAFAKITQFFSYLFKEPASAVKKISALMLPVCLGILIYLQGGIKVSSQLPSTLPNGFMKSYYDIIDDYLPYSYATVGPEIEQINAMNRHYFMNYDFFLNRYSAIDSVYHEQLKAVDDEESLEYIPPASIFVFVEKPPYGSIQQGILYDADLIMRDLEQWIAAFKNLKNRQVEVYYEDAESKVYHIKNRERESNIDKVLLQVHPDHKGKTILDE